MPIDFLILYKMEQRKFYDYENYFKILTLDCVLQRLWFIRLTNILHIFLVHKFRYDEIEEKIVLLI